MPNPKNYNVATINSSAVTEILANNLNFGGGNGWVRLINTSDVAMTYLIVTDGSTPNVSTVNTTGTTLAINTPKNLTPNTNTRIFVVSASGSNKRLEVEYMMNITP